MRRFRYVLPVLVVGLIAAACVPTKPPAPDPCEGTEVTVTAANLCGWDTEVDGTASSAFVTGPATPPAGAGSHQFVSGDDDDAGGEARLLSPLFATPLVDITTLRYSTLISDYAGGGGVPNHDNTPHLTGVLALGVDTDGDLLTTDDQARLIFEPCYTKGDCASPIQSPLNTWAEWETIGNDKIWWLEAPVLGTELCGGLPSAPGGAEFKNLTSLILTDCPEALVFQITLRGGQVGGGAPWLDFAGAVDQLVIATGGPETTFDFEA